MTYIQLKLLFFCHLQFNKATNIFCLKYPKVGHKQYCPDAAAHFQSQVDQNVPSVSRGNTEVTTKVETSFGKFIKVNHSPAKIPVKGGLLKLPLGILDRLTTNNSEP